MIDGELLKMREAAGKRFSFDALSHDFLIKLVFNSLSFDSDLITEEDVQRFFRGEDLQDAQKSMLIRNQRNGFLQVVKMAKENIPMDENNLKDLHQILMDGFSSIGGLYRNVGISLSYSQHTPPSHEKVYDRMHKYFDFCLQEPTNLWEYISYCHLQLTKIHPFLDGNGRLSRLVLNYHLMRFGFLPVVITAEFKQPYFDSLEEFKVNKNIAPFMALLKELEQKSLDSSL
ncbi:MAG: Fic family protein [Bacilli bacterium]|jgi:Fic family protein|nr:Fic family protein [Bacilli bacterium]MDY0064592.1 Fic family protein [Bacilli bacterium]